MRSTLAKVGWTGGLHGTSPAGVKIVQHAYTARILVLQFDCNLIGSQLLTRISNVASAFLVVAQVMRLSRVF